MAKVKYKIYQLRSIRNTDYAFRGWDEAKDHGFDISDYAEVYSGEIPQKNCLDELFYKFNMDHPADFTGHSLSVSDMVAIKTERNDYWYWYYCDSFGWEEITEKVNG